MIKITLNSRITFKQTTDKNIWHAYVGGVKFEGEVTRHGNMYRMTGIYTEYTTKLKAARAYMFVYGLNMAGTLNDWSKLQQSK